MRSRPNLTTARAAEIWTEMLSIRRQFYEDATFFKMPEPWEAICEGSDLWSIKTYKSNQSEDYKRKAGVVAFEDRVTLTVDEKLMTNARKGCKLSNFILAHEWGHLALDHHAKGAVTKHFQLFSGPNGMSNLPPTLEELEANYAAVFFQCGVSLANPKQEPLQLAHRACSDVYYVKKASVIARLDVFQRELLRPRPIYERVVL